MLAEFLVYPVFPIWTPLGYTPSDNSSILTESYVKSQ